MLPSGTVTFLFTDIAGSTQLWDSFPEEMRAALATHDQVVGAAVESAGGHLVKHTGDGVFAAFSSAPAAARAAVDAQHRLHSIEWDPAIGALSVRMALHTDSIEPTGDDYHGTPINTVARIEAAAHGGQILLSDATERLVRTYLPSGHATIELGTHVLRGLRDPVTIFQMVVPDLPETFPPLRSATTSTANLPEFATSFVGRAADLDAIAGLFAEPECRMVTLVGPGGMGKTRLGVEAARRCAGGFGSVAHLVSLAPLESIDEVVKAVAESLDFTPDMHALSATFSEKTQVFDRLSMHPTVLVLDNYEHLSHEAQFAAEMLSDIPSLRLIVTSREALRVPGEWVYEVGGLDTGTGSDALELFVARARQAGAHIAADDAGARSICETIGGLPLAIELAAAWTPMLSTDEIDTEIKRSLDFLEADGRGIPSRHRSLRAVFDYSWNLLDQSDQDAVARLSVFPAAFTREAAADVTGASTQTLFKLAKRSLIGRAAIDRFVLHPMVRQYAGERLEVERESLEARHARYFARILLDHAADLAGSVDQVGVRDSVMEEIEHVRAAAQWLVRHGDPGEILPVMDALKDFYFLSSWTEGADHFARLAVAAAERAGEDSQLDDEIYLWARVYEAQFALNFEEPTVVEDRVSPVLAGWERRGGRGLAWCLYVLGNTAVLAGDVDRSLAFYERAEAVECDRDSVFDLCLAAWRGWSWFLAGDPQKATNIWADADTRAAAAHAELGRAYLLSKLGVGADGLGDHRAAAEYQEQAREVFVKFDDVAGQAYAVSRMSWTSYLEGEYELAVRHGLDALDMFEEVNHRWGTIAARCRAATAEIELGRIESALQRLHEALDRAEAAGMVEQQFYALVGIGRAWAKAGHVQEAATLLAFADASDGNPYTDLSGPALAELQAGAEPAALAVALEHAVEMTLDEALVFARSRG